MSSDVLRVKNWNKDFESAKSREYNHRSQFYCPNKHGLGYQRILASPNGEAIYGCWQAMCQVLSRQEKPRHGYLTDTGRSDGIQWTTADIALVTRYSEKTCAEMVALCSSKAVGWLEVISVTDTVRILDWQSKDAQYRYPSPLPSPLPIATEHGYPTPESMKAIFPSLNTDEINAAWNHYVSIRAAMKGKPFSQHAAELMLRELHRMGPDKALRSIEASTKAGWPDVYDPDAKASKASGKEVIYPDADEAIRKAHRA